MNRTCLGALVALSTALSLSLACGGGGGFSLTSDDNRPELLRKAFAMANPPPAGVPINETGKPMVFLVSAAKGKTSVVAYDLAADKIAWTAKAEVKSRLLTGRKFVAHFDGNAMVAHDVASGKELWKSSVDGKFLGAAADAERIYYVTQSSGSKPTWSLVALNGGNGAQLWSAPSPGQLGTPAARGGLVFSPFLKQWLVILDAKSGKQLARIRGLEEEISFVRDTSENVYFGSKQGVVLLDERAASGKPAGSTYGAASLPKQFVRSFYHWDAFDPVQAGYSAYDRNRILWRGKAADDKLAFDGDRVVVHTYRFFFGFDAASGKLIWAYNHPRVDAVSSDHLGKVVGFVSYLGEVAALDPADGSQLFTTQIDLGGGTVRGATFDADGWAPTGKSEPLDTARALVSIAADRDARFLDVKLFALSALGALTGGDVTGDLLAIVQNEKTPPKVYDKAVQVLVQRKDVTGLPTLVKGLSVRYDFIAGTKPVAVGVIARAIAAMGDLSAQDNVSAETRGAVVEALVTHLFDPQTAMPNLTHIVTALGSVRLPGTMAPLRRFLLTYRADPGFSSQVAAVGATIDALLANGGVAERELVAFVAEDARTQAGVAEYAAQALRQTDFKREQERAGGAKDASAAN